MRVTPGDEQEESVKVGFMCQRYWARSDITLAVSVKIFLLDKLTFKSLDVD